MMMMMMMMMKMTQMKLVNSATKFRPRIDKFSQPNSGGPQFQKRARGYIYIFHGILIHLDIYIYIHKYIYVHIYIYTCYIITIISTLQLLKYESNYNLNCHLHTHYIPITYQVYHVYHHCIQYVFPLYPLYPIYQEKQNFSSSDPHHCISGHIFWYIYYVNGHTNPQTKKKNCMVCYGYGVKTNQQEHVWSTPSLTTTLTVTPHQNIT